jgi:hypothetical protein
MREISFPLQQVAGLLKAHTTLIFAAAYRTHKFLVKSDSGLIATLRIRTTPDFWHVTTSGIAVLRGTTFNAGRLIVRIHGPIRKYHPFGHLTPSSAHRLTWHWRLSKARNSDQEVRKKEL